MDKLIELQKILKDMQSVLIAYSGGVDSSFLLKTAKDVLGDNCIAVTGESETFTSKELENAKNFASTLGVKHLIVHTNELQNVEFTNNPPERCYHCKKELYGLLKKIAACENKKFIIDGTNLDDTKDFRPGRKASQELGIRSPLVEAKFTKSEIREYSKQLSLPTWDKPAQACLSSRFPYGEHITSEKLNIIAQAEDFLQQIGFKNIRVRFQSQGLARIELGKDELEKINIPQLQKQIVPYFKKLGFKYVTLDLEGYRTGSMNEVLSDQESIN